MKRKALKWSLVLVCLLIVQIVTFQSISTGQLESKLLPDHFPMPHRADTAYVRDFYYSFCATNMFTPLSHNLKDSQELKEKLNVKFLVFAESANEPAEESYDVSYHTWMQNWDWDMPLNLFKVTQVEELQVGNNIYYKRQVDYRWCLFFWIETFEFISADFRDRK